MIFAIHRIILLSFYNQIVCSIARVGHVDYTIISIARHELHSLIHRKDRKRLFVAFIHILHYSTISQLAQGKNLLNKKLPHH